jgi:membrane-anchored protein YejM (alkaline phosphatase superfamily)
MILNYRSPPEDQPRRKPTPHFMIVTALILAALLGSAWRWHQLRREQEQRDIRSTLRT